MGLEKKSSWGIDPRRAIPSVHRDINYPTEELLASELARSFPFARATESGDSREKTGKRPDLYQKTALAIRELS